MQDELTGIGETIFLNCAFEYVNPLMLKSFPRNCRPVTVRTYDIFYKHFGIKNDFSLYLKERC